MPSFCDYKNCHNLASSTYGGYCNEYHYDRAKIQELKERIKSIEKGGETPLVSYAKESALKPTVSQKKSLDSGKQLQ